jgi:hypothetical protein
MVDTHDTTPLIVDADRLPSRPLIHCCTSDGRRASTPIGTSPIVGYTCTLSLDRICMAVAGSHVSDARHCSAKVRNRTFPRAGST